MSAILLVIFLLILFDGFCGGYYGYSHYGMGGRIGIFGIVLNIAMVIFVFSAGADMNSRIPRFSSRRDFSDCAFDI